MKHGPERGQRGTVSLEIRAEGTGARVTLKNPGAFVGRRPGGEGIKMVERRLELAYGSRSKLELAAVGEQTTAELLVFDLGPGRAEET